MIMWSPIIWLDHKMLANSHKIEENYKLNWVFIVNAVLSAVVILV